MSSIGWANETKAREKGINKNLSFRKIMGFRLRFIVNFGEFIHSVLFLFNSMKHLETSYGKPHDGKNLLQSLDDLNLQKRSMLWFNAGREQRSVISFGGKSYVKWCFVQTFDGRGHAICCGKTGCLL